MEERLRETEEDPVLEVAPVLVEAPLLLETEVPLAVLAVREAAEEFRREAEEALLDTDEALAVRHGL